MNTVIHSHAKTVVVHEHDMAFIAEELYNHRDHVGIYTFEGSLGAGKTTLVQHMLRAWGVAEVAPSPTFSYVNIYTVQKDGQVYTLYHFDLYRLDAVDSFLMHGFNEYLYQKNAWVFIEWPEIILPLLHDAVCAVSIEHTTLDSRTITYCCAIKS